MILIQIVLNCYLVVNIFFYFFTFLIRRQICNLSFKEFYRNNYFLKIVQNIAKRSYNLENHQKKLTSIVAH